MNRTTLRELKRLAKHYGTPKADMPKSPENIALVAGVGALEETILSKDNWAKALATLLVQDLGGSLGECLEVAKALDCMGENQRLCFHQLATHKLIFRDMSEDACPWPWRTAAWILKPLDKKPAKRKAKKR